MDVLEHITSIPDPVVADKARKAIQVLRRTCALYTLDKIAFSFNGGKDSTVLLHVLRAAVTQQNGSESRGLGGIKSFYFHNTDDFPEVKDFVDRTDMHYGLNVDYLREPDFKKGLSDYLARTGVMAIVLGTRKGDPNGGNQDCFCPSSDGWPPFMRVNPIIDWTYHDVWVFLRATNVAYCNLYDHGYTSLGGTGNTLPNSALRRSDGSYEPAYKLADGRLERMGRVHLASSKPGSLQHHAQSHPETQPYARRHGQDDTNDDHHHHLQQPPSPRNQQQQARQATVPKDGPQSDVEDKYPAGGDGGDISSSVDDGAHGGSRQTERARSSSGGRHGQAPTGAGCLTHSAAIVIIGDELLSGKVKDVNAHFLCQELRSIGWQVTRIVFVPDNVDEIASAVRALAAVVHLVFTAGGIGPTLDDVTMQGIAHAVGQPLVRLPALVKRLASYFGGEEALTEAHLKMAEAPQHTELIDYAVPESGQVSKFPLVKVNNIYVLPGVPKLLIEKWTALKIRLQEAALAPFHNAILRLSLRDETTVAPALVRVASTHGLDVAVGSYPVDHGIIITFESKNAERVEAAVAEMQELLPGESVVALERDVDSFVG